MVNGRKKTPTYLRLLKGAPGKKLRQRDSIDPEPVLIPPPASLSAVAKQVWKETIPSLYALKLFSRVDVAALSAYCHACAVFKQATKKMGDDLTIQTTNGNWIQNPMLGIANRAASDMVRYAAEFGMTPSARARISSSAEAPKDEAEKYFS